MPADKDQEIDFCQSSQLARLQLRLADRSPDQLSGDACAAWFWTQRGNDPVTGLPRNIVDDIVYAIGTDIKLIALVRDPVQRAISGYLHHIRHRSLDPHDGILDACPTLGITTLSHYGMHLNNWLHAFPAANMMIVPAPCEADPGSIFRTVLEFLQLGPGDRELKTDQTVMPGLNKVMQADGLWVSLDDDNSFIHACNPANKYDGACGAMSYSYQIWVVYIHYNQITRPTSSFKAEPCCCGRFSSSLIDCYI